MLRIIIMNEDSWGFYSSYSELEEKTNILEESLIRIATEDDNTKRMTIKYDWYQAMYAEIQKALKYRDDGMCDILTEKLNYALRVTFSNFWVIKKLDEPFTSSDEESDVESISCAMVHMGELRSLFINVIKEFVEDLYYDLEDYMFEKSLDDTPVRIQPRNILGHSLSRTWRVQKAAKILSGANDE